jgi:hypothetical protein
MEKKLISVRHNCNIGDLIASLAGLKGFYEENGSEFVYMQELDVDATYHTNYYHPTQNNGKQVMCNKTMFDMIKPLVECQPYINKFVKFSGQKVVVDFVNIRGTIDVNIPHGAIQSWYSLAFPDLHFDISRAWIDVPRATLDKKLTNKILINFTSRYRNQFIHYFFLKEYEKDLLFTGTQKEHQEFCEKWNLNIPLLVVKDFLELAQIMQQSRFFLGNQSFCWNLNRAMNLPSILEMFPLAPNCIPFIGNHNYGFYHQKGVEYYFNYLIEKTKIEKNYEIEHQPKNKPCVACGKESYLRLTKQDVEYFQCGDCETIFSKTLPNGNMVGGGFEIERNENHNKERFKRIYNLLGNKMVNESNILDFGCGNGLFVDYLKNIGFNVVGYDKYSDKFDEMPLTKFDIVTMVEVIEHLSHPFLELDIIRDLIVNNGLLYIETSFVDVAEEENIKLEDFFYIDPSVGHSTIFSHLGLELLLEKKGFTLLHKINRNTFVFKKK